MIFEIADGDGEADIRIGYFAAHLQPDLFRDPTDDAARKRLFASSVQNVTLELSAYCNRRCGFCPNTHGSRLKGEKYLPQETYERIMRDLASISYSGRIFFHLYNEPLAAPEVLLERMRFARGLLPNANFAINTNGDYLTPQLLARLEGAGCDNIFVSVYGPDHGRWDDRYIKSRVESIGKLLGLEGPVNSRPGIDHVLAGKMGTVELRVAGRNLWKSGYDRGGLVPELAVERTNPCLSPVTEFIVDHRGYSLPCCNVYTDEPAHIKYTTGNLNDSDIFTVYAGQAQQKWRAGVLKFDPKGSLCGSCSRGEWPALATPKNREAISALRVSLRIDKSPQELPSSSFQEPLTTGVVAAARS